MEGSVLGQVTGTIYGYAGKHLLGIVDGRVLLGVRGKIRGTIIGDGINVAGPKGDRLATKVARRARS